ncbi:arsenite efflux transporter metallochaperone ArsD [Oceanirhabdus seepicola]|uniref:Arsenite efflux transporter metallochaperone ArsD n=1 Tax=Oceanirhabdus seepicola TaxID=2828781 RepID=A0A9J6P0E0_9CLOT|nr:arsenite efflux transporter metallochaperone ArsD [Oceanirhabdus seepicola]MCM1989341.1 arsenite efflux transporter metallochaperone ArsD [Oceanirhabdus seepicola]
MKIEFFEPPMCCSTGVCGPTVDLTLVALMDDIKKLKVKYDGLEIERYMISQQPLKFKENEAVYKLVKEQGKDVLPIVTFNGKVIKTNGYPTFDEMEKCIGDE